LSFGINHYLCSQKINNMKKIYALLCLFCPLMAFSQATSVTYVTENEKCIIWQPGVKLTFEMFENVNPDTADIRIMKKVNSQLMPYTLLAYVVDVPKVPKVIKRGRKKILQPDKGYFAAEFSKSWSCIIGRDSFDLKCAQLIWDAQELSTRVSRIWLDDVQKKIGKPTDNLYTMYLMTAVDGGREYFGKLFSKILNYVQTPRDQDRYLEYRRWIDKELESTSKFATSKEEATRFILGKPIDPDMEQAKSIVGVLGGGNQD